MLAEWKNREDIHFCGNFEKKDAIAMRANKDPTDNFSLY